MTISVVHVIDSGGFYGAEVMLVNLCQEQLKQGLTVEVISIGVPSEKEKEVEIRLRDAGVSVLPWRMKPLPDPRESKKIIKYCRSKEVDVIHSHGYKGNILLGLLPRAHRKIPVVTTVHGYTKEEKLGKLFLYQTVDRVCLKRLDAVVIVSESMRQQVPERSLEKKLHVVNNGLPSINEIYWPNDYQTPFRQGELKIGSLGRFSFEKNFALLINAMKIVVNRLPQARLVIYGEGPLRSDLQHLVNENNLVEHIKLPGYLHDTASFFSDLDIFVNCSLTEGMPISLLEAMRQGCRIVATDIDANRGLLQTLSCKTYLSQITADALAESIISATNETALEIASQKKCYQQTFNEYFSSRLMAKKYTDIYSKVKR